MTCISPPTVIGGMTTLLQVGALKFDVCCNSKPVDGADHATMMLLVAVRRMFNNDATVVAGGVYSSVSGGAGRSALGQSNWAAGGLFQGN